MDKKFLEEYAQLNCLLSMSKTLKEDIKYTEIYETGYKEGISVAVKLMELEGATLEDLKTIVEAL